MADSKIQWTDRTWNVVTGCSKVSAGCANCYAERMTRRQVAMGTKKYAAGFDTVVCHPGELETPLHWKKPRRVFVNSMSDLFHKDVPFEFLDCVQTIKLLCPQHDFQTLTKRPERMAEYYGSRWYNRVVNDQWFDRLNRRRLDKADGAMQHAMGRSFGTITCGPPESRVLPNEWLGTSVENQAAADERIPHLLRCPAAVQFLSLEPLLGLVFLPSLGFTGPQTVVDWVIVGGESGPGARPMKPEWVRSIRDQCEAAGVPFFFKGFGKKEAGDKLDGQCHHAWPKAAVAAEGE